MKKRILIFSLVYLPKFVGGAEVAIKEITDRLGDSFDFDMVTLRLKGEPRFEKVGNVNVYRIGFLRSYLAKVMYPVLAFFKAVSLHRKNKYNGLWSMMTYMGFPALFFKWFFRKVPFLLTIQDGDSIEHITKRTRIRMVSFLLKRIFKKADHIQVLSKYLADFSRDMKATCPITIVPNGVNIDHFSRVVSEEEKQEVYKKISDAGTFVRKENDVLIITTSRLVKKNAVGDVIESLVHLPANHKLIICGTGIEKEKLQEKVASHDFINRVYFADHTEHGELPVWLQASDIFIRPSLSEGFGISFVEAMAAKIPVIATPVGGIVDFLHDRETGLFCSVSNPKSIADKVLELTSDKDLKNRIVSNAFNMVQEKYDWNNVAGQMKNIFVKITEKGSI